MRWALLLGTALLGTACAPDGPAPPAPAAEDPTAAARRPDVFVVVVDTLRADRLSVYGGPVAVPFVESLARDGVVFDAAWAASSWTPPSTASLFTGLYPDQHQVHSGLLTRFGEVIEGERALNRIPRAMLTLPEVFRDAGYVTIGVADNPNLRPELGFDDGFDHFATLPAEGSRRVRRVTEELLGEAAGGDRPLFCYLHLMDPHAPYRRWPRFMDGPAEDEASRRARLLAAYDSEVAHVDANLAELFDAIEPGPGTLLVFASDHGEEFADHGRFGHRGQVFEELLHVPLLFAGGPVVGGRRTDRVVSLVDVLPTLVELLDLGADFGTPLDGRSFADWLVDPEARLEARPVFAHRLDEESDHRWTLETVRVGDRKLIEGGGVRLHYDLAEDPDELEPLAPPPAMVEALDRFTERPVRFEREFTAAEALDHTTVELLEELGYGERE